MKFFILNNTLISFILKQKENKILKESLARFTYSFS